MICSSLLTPRSLFLWPLWGAADTPSIEVLSPLRRVPHAARC